MESIIAETMKHKKENTFFIFSIVYCSYTRNIRELVLQKCNSVREGLLKKMGEGENSFPQILYWSIKTLNSD